MLTLPLPLLLSFLLGLIALGLLALAVVLLYKAFKGPVRRVRYRHETHRHDTEVVEETRRLPLTSGEHWRDPAVLTPLIAGLALLLLVLGGGRYLIQFAFPAGQDEPHSLAGEGRDLMRPDGTKIHVELYGPAGAPTLILTHGWGTSNAEWYYAKRHLADRFRLIVWDLPGLGQSDQPVDRNFALERMAADLRTVLTLADGRPVVLVGHSIGGMINLTFCRLYPELLGSQVVGVVQIDTSYTNPVKTTKGSRLSLALQKPVAEPVLHLMIGLSPVVRAMNWLSYQSGLTYLQNAHSSFAGSETRGQLDLVSRYQYESSPAVVARGTLGMFHWDATPVLPRVSVPVLILVGQQDTTTLPSASEYMKATIPKAQLQIMNPSAHYGLLEQNDKFDSALANFASAPGK